MTLEKHTNEMIYQIEVIYMFSTDSLLFVMDETSAPYEQNENPFPQTDSDNEFEDMIIKKYNLITKEMEAVN